MPDQSLKTAEPPVDSASMLKEKGLFHDLHTRALIENLPVAIYTCDINGYITYFNEAAVLLWGRRPELGKDLWCGSWKIFNPDGTALPLDECPMAITLRTGEEISGREIVILCPDGSRKNIMPSPRPLFNEQGEQVGAVNLLLDITEQKIAEKETGMLAAIIQSSDDAVISKTLEGVVTSWNAGAQRLFGYTADEMIGQPILKLIPPDRSDEEPLILERLKKGERVEHFETKRVAKDGTLLDISLTISTIRDKQGKIIGASKIARDITAQKKLNDALKESEERIRLAIEATQLGTWEYFPATGKLGWSEECRDIFDLPKSAQVTYDLYRSLIHPADLELADTAFAKALDPAGNGSYHEIFRILSYCDKKVKWIKAHGQVYFENGKPELFIGTALDITKEKTKEQGLKESVELFQTMADDAPAMIWMSGSDKFNDFFNKTWLDFTGKTLEQESNDGWLNGVHPDDRKKCTDTYKRAIKNKKGFYMEYRLMRHDGQYRWISDSCVPRYSPQEEFVGFISACMDIDDQKMFREKIQDRELLFKTISNASPVGLWMTDINARNTFVNETWIEWTGLPLEKQLGDGWLEKVLEEDKKSTPESFMECLQKREKYTTEFRIKRQDGEIRWCLTEGYPYYGANGEFAGYAGSMTDITEIKKQEQRKDDFIKMASHELKTPITSIKGYVQLLQNIYSELNEDKVQEANLTVRSSLNTISKQVSKLTRLISELLDLTRIDSGKLELHKTEFDPGILVEEAAEDVRLTTSKHAIIVQNDFEGTIYADRDRISQVLLNLLTNAVKYSPNADQVEVSVKGTDTTLIISVKDEGIGIDKKELSKIFDRFYRVEGKSEQTYPGFGIGLFIANEIVNRHDGAIIVESEKGEGSIFTITLPVTKKNN